ncbi:hypothetical protein ACG2LH_16350 [Zhouia sp. PK063]|uniref:hypothetical protein n=1 Tax=Zhouia sp. PK063 TaxID=3373602 RepID=UPI00379A519E
MKKITIIICLILSFKSFAQQNYNRLWKKVEKLELKGKTTSAAEITHKILIEALKKVMINKL